MPELIGSLVILFLVILFISLNLRILKDDEVIVVERLGSYHRTIKDKGIHFFIPFVDRPIERLSLLPITDTVYHKTYMKEIQFTYQIVDPKKFCYAANDTLSSIKDIIIEKNDASILDIESDEELFLELGVRIIAFNK